MSVDLLLDGDTSIQVGDQRESRVVFLEVDQRTGVECQQIGGVLEQFYRPVLQPISVARTTVTQRLLFVRVCLFV